MSIDQVLALIDEMRDEIRQDMMDVDEDEGYEMRYYEGQEAVLGFLRMKIIEKFWDLSHMKPRPGKPKP